MLTVKLDMLSSRVIVLKVTMEKFPNKQSMNYVYPSYMFDYNLSALKINYEHRGVKIIKGCAHTGLSTHTLTFMGEIFRIAEYCYTSLKITWESCFVLLVVFTESSPKKTIISLQLQYFFQVKEK